MILNKRKKNRFTSTIDFLHNNIMVVIVVFVVIIGIAATVYILQGKGSGTKNSGDETKYVADNTISFAIPTPNDLNVLTTKENDVYYIWPLIYSSMFKFDENLTAKEDLVDSYSTDSSAGTVTIKLKDAVFSNGEPVLSTHVRTTVNTIKAIGSDGPFYSYASKIKNISLDGDRDLTVFFESPSDASMNNLVFPIIYDADKDSFGDRFSIGSGQYSYNSMDTTNGISLIPNEKFYGEKGKSNIQFKFVQDKNAIEGLMGMGTVTCFLYDGNITSIEAGTDKLNYDKVPSSSVEFIGFNFRNNLLSKKYIRKAIAQGIDTDALSEDYLGGLTEDVGTLYFPNYLGEANEPKIKYEPSKGVILLEKNGYEFDEKSKLLKDKDGAALSFGILVNNNNKSRVDMAEAIKANLNKLGISAYVDAVSSDDYFSRISEGNFDLYIGGISMDPRFDLRKMFDKSGPIGYSNMDVVNAIYAMETCIKTEERVKLYKSVKEALVDDVAFYPIGYKQVGFISGKKFHHKNLPTFYDKYLYAGTWTWERPEGVSK